MAQTYLIKPDSKGGKNQLSALLWPTQQSGEHCVEQTIMSDKRQALILRSSVDELEQVADVRPLSTGCSGCLLESPPDSVQRNRFSSSKAFRTAHNSICVADSATVQQFTHPNESFLLSAHAKSRLQFRPLYYHRQQMVISIQNEKHCFEPNDQLSLRLPKGQCIPVSHWVQPTIERIPFRFDFHQAIFSPNCGSGQKTI